MGISIPFRYSVVVAYTNPFPIWVNEDSGLFFFFFISTLDLKSISIRHVKTPNMLKFSIKPHKSCITHTFNSKKFWYCSKMIFLKKNYILLSFEFLFGYWVILFYFVDILFWCVVWQNKSWDVRCIIKWYSI